MQAEDTTEQERVLDIDDPDKSEMLRTVDVHWNREEDEFTYVSPLKMSSTEQDTTEQERVLDIDDPGMEAQIK
ncbi:hypothetical protein T11_2768 [Trichinella zimbabwensis]|uniref:Uncharacterized protein n=1 Tax=Trichinella zimbabwensis TaxID=268475 RepID=A0A0V1GCL1_9BILA|nr:hypothetical protein T11_2768 [Trichinella zimbabwensis]